MILPILKTMYNSSSNAVKKTYVSKYAKQQNVTNNTELSGFCSPIASYVTFGWCTGHYQAMYEIDEKFSQKINDKIQEIESIKNKINNSKGRYTIIDAAAVQAAKILTQYANFQCVVAEVPPSYAVVTAGKLKEAMSKTQTYTDPVSLLIAINAINEMSVKNDALDENHLQRGKGATQLYATAMVLDQIKEQKDNPNFSEYRYEIDNLTKIVEESLKKIYGEDILDRIAYLGNMGKTPTDEQKSMALDFLIEVDYKAEDMNLPPEYKVKLQKLMDKINEKEERVEPQVLSKSETFSIKINYPDHDHTYAHAHGISHTHHHDHNHTHEHSHQSEYERILSEIKTEHGHKHIDSVEEKKKGKLENGINN